MQTPTNDLPSPGAVARTGVPPLAWIAGGVAIALTGVGIASALTMRNTAPAEPVPVQASLAPNESVQPARAPAAQHSGEQRVAQAAPHQNVCKTCGVVESVQAVKKKGEGSGVGAVGGAVVGGVLGHQVGGGRGKDAMTVLGAIGGGLAGNEIEKNVRAETVYTVQVRMDDGSVRTLTQKTAPTVGARVTVDHNGLHTQS
jgi:outer membrane lipoprotein SlyB